jgi:phosphate starvation-inducible PhoH-like protein
MDRLHLHLEPEDNHRLRDLCGQLDQTLHQLEQHLDIRIHRLGHQLQLHGTPDAIQTGARHLQALYAQTADGPLSPEQIHLQLHTAEITTKRGRIQPRSAQQAAYLERIRNHALNFGIGPAGTGKTYLAVAGAVAALQQDQIKRILLVRPAVEAGERLGFLPGDLNQKIDPYLRPLYDALYDMLGQDRVHKLLERQVIEVAPLAYMRGRTLNEAFILLDEAQNTTCTQMKMFLTRLGFGSTAVVTGDLTQIDLPGNQPSGLKQALDLLHAIPDISITRFGARDVVRHHLVQQIIHAYDQIRCR